MDTRDIARHYDHIPYTSRPFPQSHPQRMAALGRLFGLTPPNLSNCKVLELGCASGGNLIPLAAAFPDAQFVGIDLSGVQIAEGQARITRLGFKNIRLINMSIADVTTGLGAFDYIICHGVYSWVPLEVRDAILRVAHDNLSEHGMAYISYNVYPGWRLRTVLRDAMLFHSSTADDPAEKIARGRDFLDKLGTLSNASSAYGQLLRQEAGNMAKLEDDYIAHEYLEANNDPCYFADFVKRAEIFDLSYLTESELHLTIAENFGAETGALLRSLSANGLERLEQYIDFLTGRTFRQSLLVRREQAHRIGRVLNPQSIAGLHLSTGLAPDPEIQSDSFIFKDRTQRTLTTTSPAVRDAVSRLARMYPLTATPDELVNKSGGAHNDQDKRDIERSLFNMVMAGIADISSVPFVASATVEPRPTALPLARADARHGQTWTTNVRHETVPLGLVARAVLPMLDGTNSQTELIRKVQALVAEGAITFHKDGEKLLESEQIDAAIDNHISDALSGFRRAALLVA